MMILSSAMQEYHYRRFSCRECILHTTCWKEQREERGSSSEGLYLPSTTFILVMLITKQLRNAQFKQRLKPPTRDRIGGNSFCETVICNRKRKQFHFPCDILQSTQENWANKNPQDTLSTGISGNACSSMQGKASNLSSASATTHMPQYRSTYGLKFRNSTGTQILFLQPY